jgi:hypothetical protein
VREAPDDNPRLAEMPTEEVARQLVLGRYLKAEPSLPLGAEALQTIEAEEGNPT